MEMLFNQSFYFLYTDAFIFEVDFSLIKLYFETVKTDYTL